MPSAADTACTLVADLLKDGPRNAAEILAATEGANISERTIQRAAIALGVQKMKAGFDGGWTWRLPDDEGGNTDAPIEQPAPGVSNNVRVQPTGEPSRAEVIAARLRKLEAGRGRVGPFYATDPRVIRWAQSGISDPDLREAYELAVFALEGECSPAPVTAGFLDKYIDQVLLEGAKA